MNIYYLHVLFQAPALLQTLFVMSKDLSSILCVYFFPFSVHTSVFYFFIILHGMECFHEKN